MTRHQYGISAFLRRHFAEKPVAESQNVACALKLLLGPKYEYAGGGGGGGMKGRSGD